MATLQHRPDLPGMVIFDVTRFPGAVVAAVGGFGRVVFRVAHFQGMQGLSHH